MVILVECLRYQQLVSLRNWLVLSDLLHRYLRSAVVGGVFDSYVVRGSYIGNISWETNEPPHGGDCIKSGSK